MRYCQNCGNVIYDNTMICPNCGASQYNEVHMQSNNTNQASLRGNLIGFILTFFIGIIGLILCLILGDEK